MGAVPLWPLVSLRRIVGLVAWAGFRRVSSDLGAGLRYLLRIWRRSWGRVWLRLDWLAADRSVRLLPSVVGWMARPVRRGGVRPHWRFSRRNQAAARGVWLFEPA